MELYFGYLQNSACQKVRYQTLKDLSMDEPEQVIFGDQMDSYRFSLQYLSILSKYFQLEV